VENNGTVYGLNAAVLATTAALASYKPGLVRRGVCVRVRVCVRVWGGGGEGWWWWPRSSAAGAWRVVCVYVLMAWCGGSCAHS
jgi:hypothetical protein